MTGYQCVRANRSFARMRARVPDSKRRTRTRGTARNGHTWKRERVFSRLYRPCARLRVGSSDASGRGFTVKPSWRNPESTPALAPSVFLLPRSSSSRLLPLPSLLFVRLNSSSRRRAAAVTSSFDENRKRKCPPVSWDDRGSPIFRVTEPVTEPRGDFSSESFQSFRSRSLHASPFRPRSSSSSNLAR